MMLAAFLAMTGRVDRRAELASSHQPKPVELAMSFYAPGVGAMAQTMAAQFIIRPNGWTVPQPYSQAWMERYGWEDPRDERKAAPPLPRVPLFTLLGMLAPARTVMVFNAEEFDWGIRTWRVQLGRHPAHACIFDGRDIIFIDTAKDAATAMGLEDRLPSLAEATEALLGEARTGLDAVLELFGHQRLQEVRRAA